VVASETDRAHVRPAKLVAALSLGVDLGFRPRREARREGPAGLTSREVEVLRLVARGLSIKEIADRLVTSPKTVGNHVEHMYAKIGVSSRATASLFAMQNGLLPEEEVAPA
jgi:DNA-binding NarL/FixJ family response regulator